MLENITDKEIAAVLSILAVLFAGLFARGQALLNKYLNIIRGEEHSWKDNKVWLAERKKEYELKLKKLADEVKKDANEIKKEIADKVEEKKDDKKTGA